MSSPIESGLFSYVQEVIKELSCGHVSPDPGNEVFLRSGKEVIWHDRNLCTLCSPYNDFVLVMWLYRSGYADQLQSVIYMQYEIVEIGVDYMGHTYNGQQESHGHSGLGGMEETDWVGQKEYLSLIHI